MQRKNFHTTKLISSKNQLVQEISERNFICEQPMPRLLLSTNQFPPNNCYSISLYIFTVYEFIPLPPPLVPQCRCSESLSSGDKLFSVSLTFNNTFKKQETLKSPRYRRRVYEVWFVLQLTSYCVSDFFHQ